MRLIKIQPDAERARSLTNLANMRNRSKMHKTNNFVGSGLGLTIVKNIVKKFNGDLQISSEQGKGSTFIVLLPITSD